MLIGHEDIREDVSRLVREGRLSHSYLFFGPSQVGKFSFAGEVAVFLERKEWPEDASPRPLSDAMTVSPRENGSIGIDEVRAIKQFLSERPFISSRRTAIVEGAEALTPEAQNALLKTAEEPPEHALLILTVRNPEGLLPTLLSRFQKIYFGTVSKKKIASWLKHAGIAADKAEECADLSGGKPGLALALAAGENPDAEKWAKRFLSTPASSRKEFLKSLLEPEEFSFKVFLDALISVLAREKKVNSALWHAVLELRGITDATGLNPRIQLTNLWTLI